jgi:hypothetical protein
VSRDFKSFLVRYSLYKLNIIGDKETAFLSNSSSTIHPFCVPLVQF